MANVQLLVRGQVQIAGWERKHACSVERASSFVKLI
jgi:hypothetical protein